MVTLDQLDTVKKSEAGVWRKIYVDGVESGIEIKQLGPDSKVYKQNSTQIRKYVQKQKERKADVNQDEMDSKSFQLLAATTVTWRHILDEKDKDGNPVILDGALLMSADGEKLKFNTENAVTLYESYSFISDQMAEYLVDKNAFLNL